MGFGFNGIPSADVSITGGVAPNYDTLKYARYDGTGYEDFTVPANKMWVMMGYTCHQTDWITATIGGAGCNIWNYTVPFGAQMPIRLNTNDYVRVSGDGAISYYEYDV